MRKTCQEEIHKLARRDGRVLFIGSDLGSGTLERMRREMPDRFFMEGVSEAYIAGMVSGLAMNGWLPYVNAIAVFITRRCYEQVLLDAALHNLPVRFIGNGGGVVYAPLGPTHIAFEDMALMRAVPNMTIVAPCDAEEMKRLMPLTLGHQGPLYIRLGKGGEPVVSEPGRGFAIGRAIPLREGGDALLVTTGVTLQTALEAHDLLSGRGIGAAVLHVHTIKPLDAGAVLAAAGRVRAVVTLEEHSLIGGLGSAVAELLAEANLSPPPRFRRMALPDAFPSQYGSQKQVMEAAGLHAEGAVSTVLSLLKR